MKDFHRNSLSEKWTLLIILEMNKKLSMNRFVAQIAAVSLATSSAFKTRNPSSRICWVVGFTAREEAVETEDVDRQL